MTWRKSDFAYELPDDLIAQEPLRERTESRLLQLEDSSIADRTVQELPDILRPSDLLVFNNTKVMPARLFGVKETSGKVELLVERITGPTQALCQVRSSRPLRMDSTIWINEQAVTVVDKEGEFYALDFNTPLLEFLENYGSVPLPTYIRRAPSKSDLERYQTVFAKNLGAVAAPTAGLHFDVALIQALSAKGIGSAQVTLHVGAGTFQPLRTEEIEYASLHSERYHIDSDVAERITNHDGRVVAVGTTVVRTLESWQLTGELSGETDLFIRPGFNFRCVGALLTNFHLPESSLLMLVCAFAGYDRVMSAYNAAVDRRYRFYSYGDAMLCERNHA